MKLLKEAFENAISERQTPQPGKKKKMAAKLTAVSSAVVSETESDFELPEVASVDELPEITEDLVAKIQRKNKEQMQWAENTAKAVVHAEEQIRRIDVLDPETKEDPEIKRYLEKFRKVITDAEKATVDDPVVAERLKLRNLTEEIGRLIRRTEPKNGEESRYEYLGTANDLIRFLDRLATAGRFHRASKTEIYNLPAKNGKRVWPSGTFFFDGAKYFSNIRPESGNKLPAGQEALYVEIRKLIRAFEQTHVNRMKDPEIAKVGAETDFLNGVPGNYFLSHDGYEFVGWNKNFVKVRPAQMLVRVYDCNAGKTDKPTFLKVELLDAGDSALDLLSGEKFDRVARRFISHWWAVSGRIPAGNELRKDVFQWCIRLVKHIHQALVQSGAKSQKPE